MDIKGKHDFEIKPTFGGDAVLTVGAAEVSTLTEKTAPVNADLVLIEDSEAGNAKKRVQLINLGLGGELASVCGRRTTTLAASASYQDITLDTTPVENDTDVLEHDNTNTDRILIKETGLYMVGYYLANQPPVSSTTCNARVRINDTTVIAQSQETVESDDEIVFISSSFPVELTSGDFITLQVQATTSDTIQAGVTFWAVRARGSQGPQGIAGSGSSVTVKDSGTNIPNTPHTALDFVGNLAASDAGSGVAEISVLFGSEYQTARSDSESSTTSATPIQKLRMTTSALVGGNYYIGWYFEWGSDADDKNNQFRVQIDDTTTLTQLCYEDRGKATDTPAVWRPASGWDIRTLSSGAKNIDVDYWTAANTVYIRNARLVLWRVS